MIIEICNIIIFMIETLICIFYFEHKFERKYCNKIILLFAGAISFALYFIQNIKIPLINAVSYMILTFLFLYLCYKTSIKSCIFSILVLTAFMIVTEMLVMYLSSLILGTDIALCLTDDFVFATQAMIAKLLYFICVYILSKFSIQEQKSIRTVILLSILPIASVLLMHTTIYICIYNNLDNYFKSLLVICNILILISNIIVFYIHESTLKTYQKYTELLLTQQKEKNTIKYYDLLQQQNENSKVLIHDITKHLTSIRMLSSDNNASITDYIDNIYNEFHLMNPINYCNNPLLNLITYRYSEICKSENIQFKVNIQNAKLSFMCDPDITALFDNLLENAVEASKQTAEKFISFSIDIRNMNFLVISVTNSSNNRLLTTSGNMITSKPDSNTHGIGIKSIRRIVKKYDGNIEMTYDDSEKTFTTKIVFDTQKRK